MAGPAITVAEQSLLGRTVARVRAAQDARLAAGLPCMQARSGHDAEWAAVGVDPADVSAGRMSGARTWVHVYDGPSGRGWELEILLTRGGETWRRVVHRGPETWRERGWERISPLTQRAVTP